MRQPWSTLVACFTGLIFPLTSASQDVKHSPPSRQARTTTLGSRANLVDSFIASEMAMPPGSKEKLWSPFAAKVRLGMQAAMGELPAGSVDRRVTSFESLSKQLDLQVVEDREFPGYRRIRFSFLMTVGDRVPCFLLVPTNGDNSIKRAAVLALHQTIPFGKSEVADETIDPSKSRPNMRYGVELAKRGFVVLAPDYPSFGDYKYDFSKGPFPSGTMKGIVNHIRCVDILRSRQEVDPERIGAIGHSLGGHNAIFVAAFDDRVKAVVSSCGWCPFADYYEGNIKGWTSDRYMPRLKDVYKLDIGKVPFEFDEVIASLAPRAFLSVSPIFDNNFAVGGVRRGMASADRVYKLFEKSDRLQALYPTCEHDFPPDMREAAYRFLEKQLGRPAK